MGLLAALVALLCIYTAACGAEGCSSFRHLENGQTFFRYGGLLVIFRCRAGFKLHGYKTNSCVSGTWSRDTPVCVGSGCTNPGPPRHGTSSMKEDGSWTVFSCNSGFRLQGPSMLYCKGHMWNSTKPVCKESDMMGLSSGVSVQKLNTLQNLQAAVVVKTQQQSHYDTLTDTASKESVLKLSLSQTPPQMSSSERLKVTLSKVHLQQNGHFHDFKSEDGVQRTHQEANKARVAETGIGRNGSQAKDSREETEKVDEDASKSHPSTIILSTLSLVSKKEQSNPSPSPLLSTALTQALTAVTNAVMFEPLQRTKSALRVPSSEKQFSSGEPVSSWDYVSPSEVVTRSLQTDKDHQVETGFQYPPSSQPESEEKVDPTETLLTTSVHLTSTKASSPSPSLLPFYPNSTKSNIKTNVPSNTSTPTEHRAHGSEYHNINSTTPPLSLTLSRRPVCTYPPVPAHGTFYFHNVENPGPTEYKHYIQYACYPGYTLAHGDIHSYCQPGDVWNGTTPVCLELTPCSVNNGGCSQLCSLSQHHNQSSNQTQNRTQCHCKAGFTLVEDGRTCRDLNECVEGQHNCRQRCINTFGSFKCSCDDGYQPAHDQTSCTDVDECMLPAAVTGCVFGCVNTPGSFHCQCPSGYSLQTADSHCQDIDECAVNQGLGLCTEQCHNSPGSYRCSCSYGHILAGDGHSCIPECPPGYRKQPITSDNQSTQDPREECVDVNECQEEMCEWQCINLPGSHRCICPRGYTLHRDGRRCKDINECSRKNGGCSHLCVNQKGVYKCACPATHRLSPYSWKKCVPRMTASTAA
ncbi:hypothetical protein PBY51_019174 [Eleginops maclovinus]|uniref:Uncharacterized protein n=1 Tax=Eleginops maclovinus TaxID=56733 RepID=A0AAN7Y5T7_ELEMC|nr:hypothetical protein PBY51_019174 [Eleginops maclovinus]